MWCVVPTKHHLGMLSLSWVNNLFADFVPDVVKFEYEYDESSYQAARLDAQTAKDMKTGVALAGTNVDQP